MMNVRNIIALLGKGLYLPEWQPNLNQPIRKVEETLAKQERQESLQQPVNFMIANVSFLYDAQLYILFQDYVAKLPQRQRHQAIEEQRNWLITRRQLMDEAASQYEGGTLASYVAGQASIKASKERIGSLSTLARSKRHRDLREGAKKLLVHRHQIRLESHRQSNELAVVHRAIAISHKFKHAERIDLKFRPRK